MSYQFDTTPPLESEDLPLASVDTEAEDCLEDGANDADVPKALDALDSVGALVPTGAFDAAGAFDTAFALDSSYALDASTSTFIPELSDS